MCNHYLCQKKIYENIKKYNLKKFLEVGDKKMIDIEFDENAINELLKHDCCDSCAQKNDKLDLSKTLKNIEETSILQKIKKLKE